MIETQLDQNLNDTVYNKVLNMIFDYSLVPGQKIVLSDLANKLGTSRTPLNHALYHLSKEGYLDFVPNQGYTVHQPTRKETDSLYELREIIELGSIEKIINNISAEEVELLLQKEQNYRTAVSENKPRGKFYADLEFHLFIISLAGNDIMANCYRDIFRKIYYGHRIPLHGEMVVTAPTQHLELVDSIIKGDIESARQTIKTHIKNGKEYVYSFIYF